jgi:HAD superfamily phosphatase (TIGR01668 family)
MGKRVGVPLLEPERYFARISHISIQYDIIACGFDHVLLDMDNTILSRATHDVPPDAASWLADARQAGIEFCLLSNNWHRAPHEEAAKLGIAVVAKACKPLPPAFVVACRKVGGSRAGTLVIGDQLSTDILGAHLSGLRAYLVCPLVEQESRRTMAVRALERAFLGGREPEGTATVKMHEEDPL